MNFYRKLTHAVPFQYATIVFLAVAYAAVCEIFIFQNQFAPAGLMGLATLIQEAFHFIDYEVQENMIVEFYSR